MLRYLQIPILSFCANGNPEGIFQGGLDSPYQVRGRPAGVYPDENRGRNDKKGGQINIRKFKIAFLLQPPWDNGPHVQSQADV
jgi:hypothetical protein